MPKLTLHHVGVDGILHDISDTWTGGQMIGIVGPNGAGKSTLLRCIASVQKVSQGRILIDGRPIQGMTAKERALAMAYLPQQVPEDVAFTVEDYVTMGRFAHPRGRGSGKRDREAVQNALCRLELADYASLPLSQLSGGERQRVAIARCLAQESKVILLDEPISNLDIFYQIEILEQLRELAAEGYLIVLSIHHLEFAAGFCNQIALLHQGELVQSGNAEEVFTEDVMREVFRVDVRPFPDPLHGGLRFSTLRLLPRHGTTRERSLKTRS